MPGRIAAREAITVVWSIFGENTRIHIPVTTEVMPAEAVFHDPDVSAFNIIMVSVC